MRFNETHPYVNFALRCIRPNVPKMAQIEYKNFQLYVLKDRRCCVGFVMGSKVVFNCVQKCKSSRRLMMLHSAKLENQYDTIF